MPRIASKARRVRSHPPNRKRKRRRGPMQRQLSDLESTLTMLIAEHRKLLTFTDAQQAAMRAVDLGALDAAVNGQEASRLRIATLETKRRGIVSQLTKGQRLEQPVTLTKLAQLFPQK